MGGGDFQAEELPVSATVSGDQRVAVFRGYLYKSSDRLYLGVLQWLAPQWTEKSKMSS
jgi:hypothetical protein